MDSIGNAAGDKRGNDADTQCPQAPSPNSLYERKLLTDSLGQVRHGMPYFPRIFVRRSHDEGGSLLSSAACGG